MKNLFKKLSVFVMSLIVALSVGVAPALAATSSSATITVTNLPEGASVSAYQLVEYDSSTGKWVLTDLVKAVYTTEDDQASVLSTLTSSESSNSSALATILTKVASYVSSNSTTADATATAGENGSAALSTSSLGGYLIVASADGWSFTNMYASNYENDDESETNGFVDVSVTAKGIEDSDLITGKTADDTEVAVGDTVTFTVTGTFPDYRGTGSPSLVLTDTMSTGLTYDSETGVTITYTDADGTKQTLTSSSTFTNSEGTQTAVFTVATTDSDGNSINGFIVTFNEEWLQENATAIANVTFTMTYKATVSAYSSDNTYTNKIEAAVEVDGTEETDSEEEEVYTTALQLKKTNSSSEALAGVSFQVTTTIGGTTYYVALDDDGNPYLTTTKTILTTGSDGTITLSGLDPDYTYTITETETIGSYQLSAYTASVSFTLSATTDEDGNVTVNKDTDDNAVYTATVSYATSDGTTATSVSDWSVSNASTAAVTTTVTLINYVLGELPQTGDSGMVYLTIAGVGAMLVCGGVLLKLRRKQDDAE